MKDGDPTMTSLLSLMITNPNESKVIKLKQKEAVMRIFVTEKDGDSTIETRQS